MINKNIEVAKVLGFLPVNEENVCEGSFFNAPEPPYHLCVLPDFYNDYLNKVGIDRFPLANRPTRLKSNPRGPKTIR